MKKPAMTIEDARRAKAAINSAGKRLKFAGATGKRIKQEMNRHGKSLSRAEFVSRHTPNITITMQNFQRVARGVLFLCITLDAAGQKKEAKAIAQRITRSAQVTFYTFTK